MSTVSDENDEAAHPAETAASQADTESPAAFDKEHTPKRIKAMDPDVTVVVGGVKFYHYKVFLCSFCEFFDTTLSADMKETKESCIEFPDKNPEEWLEVYSFLEKLGPLSVTDNDLMAALKSRITVENATWLMTWFDFLGLNVLAERCDQVVCDEITRHFDYRDWAAFAAMWDQCSGVAFSKSKECIVEYMEGWTVEKYGPFPQPLTKQLLQDEEYGDRFWASFCKNAYLPPALSTMDRITVINNPLFDFLLVSCTFAKLPADMWNLNDLMQKSMLSTLRP